MIDNGIYLHYKGAKYQVHDVAKHSENEQWMVVYSPLYGDVQNRHLWVRPLNMFIEEINVNGKVQPRFTLIETLN